MAMASENTSRPQPPDSDRGVRNWPMAERGPKLNNAIRQPHPTTTTGVRQPTRSAAERVVILESPSPRGAQPPRCRKDRHWGAPAQSKVSDGNDLPGAWLAG